MDHQRGGPSTRRGPGRAVVLSGGADRRLARYGPNRLEEAPCESRWRPFLRQFKIF